eukprot:TRINITY_DN3968_c0_g1_i1.p1 TRINITY_DN3968_c0_g1~~TRINITY_DN3968_c0_g1_i1.p1  ORF type:complete len:2055 (-),score=796.97 TRINITY_DN3968_c0_g1_i1:227-6391(-)
MKSGKGAQHRKGSAQAGKGSPNAGKGGIKPVMVGRAAPTPSQSGKGGPQAAKRAGSPGSASGPAAKKPAVKGGGKDKAAIRVYSQTGTDDDVAATLVGNYAEVGENHGRPTFKKMEKIVGHEAVEVFVYFWDDRDGSDHSGWWFGDEVGGSQVWAMAKISSSKPPKMGWRVPWDAKTVKPGVLVVEDVSSSSSSPAAVPAQKGGKGAKDGKDAKDLKGSAGAGKGGAQAGGGGGMSTADVVAIVKKANEEVKALETTTNNMISSATKTMSNPKTIAKVVQNFIDMLQKQAVKLNERQSAITKDIAEARKAAPAAAGQITALTNCSTKLKALQTSLAATMTKLREKKKHLDGDSSEAPEPKPPQKPSAAAPKPGAAASKPTPVNEKLKDKEEKDSREFEPIRADLEDTMEQISLEVEAISSAAAPLLTDSQQLDSGDLASSLTEIEMATMEAQKSMATLRSDVANHLKKAAQYAPQARKAATEALTTFQTTLNELGKKVAQYRNFKKDFQGRQKARLALADIVTKFENAELEIEKASNMSKATELGQMSEEEVNAVLQIAKPAGTSLAAAMGLLAQKGKSHDPGMQAEVESLRSLGQSLRQRLQGIEEKMKGQREGVTAQSGVEAVQEKRKTAEKAIFECQEAEMPFLKGIEVLPKDESDTAIKASEKAAAAAQLAVGAAKTAARVRLAEAGKFVKDLRESISEQLKAECTKIEALEKKLNLFRKETTERKATAVLAEVYEALATAEQKTEEVGQATALFASADKLESATTAALEKALETAKAGEKAATTACAEATVVVAKKSRELKGGDVQATLVKLNTRVKAATDELKKHKLAIASGAKTIASKAVLEKCSTSMKDLDTIMNSIEATIMLAETGELTEEGARKLDEQLKEAAKSCRDITVKLLPALSGAPAPIKASLVSVKEKVTKAQTKVEKGRTQCKVHLEKVLAKSWQTQALAFVETLEEAVEATNEAELPFLKGLEVIPAKEALAAVEAGEKAMVTGQKALNEGRDFVAQKSIEVRSFNADIAKETKVVFTTVTERTNAASQKLVAFRKDTEIRKKAAQLQEAEAQVAELESDADAVAAAAEPFTVEGADKMTAEEASAPLEKFIKVETELAAKLVVTRKLISERQKGSADNSGQQQTVKALQQRVQEVQAKLSKAKKATGVHSQRYAAKRAVAEAAAKIDKLKGEVEKAAQACAPLLEEGGEEYLVGCSVRILANALRAHMQEKSFTDEDLFKKVAGGRNIGEGTFLKYLEGLPEAIGREDIGFPAARRASMFKALDTDKDGTISLKEFQAILQDRVIALKDITITDSADLNPGASKTVAKVAMKEEVTLLGAQKKLENGMVRGQCKVADGSTGWITLSGNHGVVFVKSLSDQALTRFMLPMEKAATAAMTTCTEAATYMANKFKEAGITHTPECKAEGQKLRPLIAAAIADVEALKRKLAAARKELAATELKEKNAQVEARERKEAAEYLDKVEPLFASVQAASKAVEEAGQQFAELDLEGVEAFATPATLLQQVETLATACTKKVIDLRKAAKEQMTRIIEVKPATGFATLAKRELGKMQTTAEAANRTSTKVLEGVRSQCKKMSAKLSKDISRALRKTVPDAAANGFDALFEELAAGKDKISEATFCAKVQTCPDLSIKDEHAKLVCRSIGLGGISRRCFLDFVQHFVAVAKEIAITDVRDMSVAKSLRKLEKEELLEVLEGPLKDGDKGLERVRCRCLVDHLEGWVTVQGNQGTSFLRDVAKPLCCVKKSVPLENAVKCGAGVVRDLKEDEVLELLEGPRMEEVPDVKRVRVKASKDGATGFLTLLDRTGTVFAEPKKLYTCTSSVAITDNANVKECKVVRKLVVGELFEATTEPEQDTVSKVWRMEGIALKDGKSGWITQRGNAGTTYVQPSKMHYVVTHATSLRKELRDEADVVRQLEVGEAVALLETPKLEKSAPESRIRVRAFSDGTTGWVSHKEPSIATWKPFYRCFANVSMRNQQASEGAQVLRELVKGDRIEYLEGPLEVDKVTVLKGRTEKGGIVGFVNIKNEEGKRLLGVCTATS